MTECTWCRSLAILTKVGAEMICSECAATISRMDILSALPSEKGD